MTRDRSRLLLQDDDPAPFSLDNVDGRADCVIVCDHASSYVPAILANLGLTSEELDSHIGWDIGALNVAERVAVLLDAPLVSSNYSRLIIDCNRYPRDGASIVTISDHTEIPGNQDLPPNLAYLRQREIFDPYHNAISELIEKKRNAGGVPVLISIHSMTARFDGTIREWPISIQSHQDKRISDELLANLKAANDFPIGDNQPYMLEFSDFTVFEHAIKFGLPHVQVEFRQDLIAEVSGAQKFADAFFEAVGPVLSRSRNRQSSYYTYRVT